MKFVDEFRESKSIRRLIDQVRSAATRSWTIMEVCGGQTHSLLRHGIDIELSPQIEMIHGPGCPVCVTSVDLIDRAVALAHEPNTTVASFGDMLRVPGRNGSLLQARSAGASVRIVYSPVDAVELARQDPGRKVVFFAVGFETTAPATALAVRRAAAAGLSNFQILTGHVRVRPAMEMLASASDCRVQGFLAAGHVAAVNGYAEFEDFAKQYGVPIVVAGFEPADLLLALRELIEHLEAGRTVATNAYGRTVSREGNRQAQDLVNSVYQPCDRDWRGIGIVPAGGLELRPEWAAFNASSHGMIPLASFEWTDDCRSGDVLVGRIKPTECVHFGNRCTPDSPLGAPMVSSEGACAAYFRYAKTETAQVCSSENQ